MKKHAIIPIFIPQEGCPNGCVFCNQKKITARQQSPDREEVHCIIESYLSTLSNPRPEVIEIAMYGGSFTGIPIEKQKYYLEIALDYKNRGIIDKIHLSTRPDYVNESILEFLKSYGVDIIELGVQSFDDEVLERSERGHNSNVIYESCHMIKEHGFSLGIQLMIGLPADTREKSLFSAAEAVKMKPDLARLYPTVIIEDTPLLEMFQKGEYVPFSLDEMVFITKDMYCLLADAGIQILRVGLKSSDIICKNGQISGHNYHPAFRQLVESEIAKAELESQLKKIQPVTGHEGHDLLKNSYDGSFHNITFFSHPKSFSNMIGNRGCNKFYFKEKYPCLRILYKTDSTLSKGNYLLQINHKK